jgi:hypothetical protein
MRSSILYKMVSVLFRFLISHEIFGLSCHNQLVKILKSFNIDLPPPPGRSSAGSDRGDDGRRLSETGDAAELDRAVRLVQRKGGKEVPMAQVKIECIPK